MVAPSGLAGDGKMRIHVREDAEKAYRQFMYATGQSPSMAWAEKLQAVQGMWLEVETEHLFLDQYNTSPITGITELGLRLFNRDIDAIENDVRERMKRCSWCGKCCPKEEGSCPKCGKSEYFETFDTRWTPTGAGKES